MTHTRRTLLQLPAVPVLAAMEEAGLHTVPNCCTHEHWGSVDSIGMTPEGFRADVEQGATPSRATDLFDLLLDPYARGVMNASGGGPAEVLKLARESPWAAYQKLTPLLARYGSTGIVQCVRRGVLRLYGADLTTLDRSGLARLNEAIARRYTQPFGWYADVMRRMNFSDLIRPVHPEFYLRRQSPETAARERIFTRTVLRIDPLLELWREDSQRRKALAEATGVEPGDAASWRAFLEKIFSMADAGGAVGIKQLQAYRRPLDFAPQEKPRFRGDLNPAELRVLQDWIVNECSRLAHEKGWPHQVHTGTHNLGESSPLPLQALARRYPKMNIVLIHCWPFLNESGWLARQTPNIYLDTCWQPILNPAFFREAMEKWLAYVPLHKITCGHDATSVEMAAGSALYTREILNAALRRQPNRMETAHMLLHRNAEGLYGVPEGRKTAG